MKTTNETSAAFLLCATKEFLLTDQQAKSLEAEAARQGIAAADLAIERGLLSRGDVEVVEDLLRPGDTVPGYEILSVLGRGGMGIVYRARQQALDRLVALKMISVGGPNLSHAAARFEQEARAAGKLQHPNIVTAYDFGCHRGRFYLAMELLEGNDLERQVRAAGAFDEATTWWVIRQAAAGLQHAAEAGIVHRDVKPANLFAVKPPAGVPLPKGVSLIKLTDFGLAFLVSAAGADSRLTQAGTTVGTPHYMAPEQLRDGVVDHRADIYALGATAYHLLTGKAPFPGSSLMDVITAKVKHETPRVAELAPRVSIGSQQLVERMMSPQVADRPPDYTSLLAAIDSLLATGVVQNDSIASGPTASTQSMVIPQPAGAAARKPAERRPAARWPWALALIAAATLATAGWFHYRANDLEASAPHLVRSGWEGTLFNGENLAGWKSSGAWSSGKDDDGALVIEGQGTLTRRLAQLDVPKGRGLSNYRFSMGVKLHEARAVAVQFGSAADGGSFYSLRYDGGSATLNFQADETSLPEPRSQISLDTSGAESGAPHELRVERHETAWRAYVDGRHVATVAVLAEQEAATIRIASEGGAAWFNSPTVAELVSAETK